MRKAKIYIDLSVFINLDYLTGIQRVSEEIILRLLKNKNTNIVLITYSEENECFRIINNETFTNCCENKIKDKSVCITDKYLEIHEMESGAVFFDIDSVWCCKFTRSKLYPLLKNQNIKIITHVYDIIPITHPQYCHENTVMFFIEYLGATLKYANHLIVNTQATADRIKTVCNKMNRKMPGCTVAPLGCDFKKANDQKQTLPSPDVQNIIDAGKYILMVGTIEPRKNHALLLDALDNGLNANVVFAGRVGWNVENLIERIKNHPLYQKRLFFIDNANDSAIDKLYENAYFLAFPTFDEGFGLPVIESIQRNTPVIASDIPVLREVGGEYADYFDNTDCTSLVKYIDNCLNDPEKYDTKKSMLKNYKAYTWDKSADIMEKALINVCAPSETVNSTDLSQMIFICENKDNISATLPFVEEYMNFIKKFLVCCPENIAELIKSEYKGKNELLIKTYEELLSDKKLPENYNDRSFLIRCLLVKEEETDDVFIMTDDNFRPVQNIPDTLFIKDGKYTGYYFYDLTRWTGALNSHTAFDKNAFKTRDFLLFHNYPTLQYSSHQPQVIDKQIFNEMLDMHPEIMNDYYDEWSMYFNFGIHHHPDIFRTKINISMCWPDNTSSWNLKYFPGPFFFENFSKSLYNENGIFEGFEETYSDNSAEENVRKSHIYSDTARKHFETQKVYDSFCEYYNEKKGEYPSFIINSDPENDNTSLHTPDFIILQNNSTTHISLKITKDIYKRYKNCTMNISYRFQNADNSDIINSPEFTIIDNGLDIQNIPIQTPKSKTKGSKMILCVSVNDSAGNEIFKEEKLMHTILA